MGSARPEDTLTVGQALGLAIEHYTAGRLTAAAGLCAAVLDVLPDEADALNLLGVIRIREGDAAAAVALLARAVKQPGAGAGTFDSYASALRMAGAADAAQAAHRRSLALDPAFRQGWFNLSNAQRDAAAEGGEAAFASLRRAACLDPAHPRHVPALAEVALGVGSERRDRGDPGVEPAYRLALALRPEFAEALINLGTFRIEGGEPGGMAALRRATRLRPDLPAAPLAVGEALARLGDSAAAVGPLRIALALAPADQRALARLGGAALALGDDAAALLCAGRGLRIAGSPAALLEVRRIAPVGDWCRANGQPYRTVLPSRRVTVDTGTERWGRLGYTLPEAFVARVDDALVVPSNHAVATADGALLLGGLHAYSKESLALLPDYPLVGGGRVVLRQDAEPLPIGEEAILLGGDGNFAHGVLDWLSRLCVLSEERACDGLPVLVSPALRPAVRALAGLLGAGPERLRALPEGRPALCRRLWLPSLTHSFQWIAPEHLAFLRSRVAAALGLGRPVPRRRLFLARRPTGHRALVNQDAVAEALAPLGFEVWYAEDHPLPEQIHTLHEAECIVAPLGGGSAAVAFAPEGVPVVELTHPRCLLPQYAILCGLLRQPFRQVVGRCVRNRGALDFDWDYVVEPAAVAAAVE